MENFRATTSDRLQDYPATRSTALLRRLASDNQFRDEFIGSFGKIVATDETDGLRYNLAGGKILHLRASGNAPELRCYTEAADSGQAQELLAAGLAAAARFTS
jgi:phosphomannomutase